MNKKFFDIEYGHVGAVVPVEGTQDKFIVACEQKILLVTWDGENDTKKPTIENLLSLDTNKTDTRVNDGKCDPAGRFLIGELNYKFNILTREYVSLKNFFQEQWH